MPNINTFVGQFNFTNDSGTIGLNIVPTAAAGIGPGGSDGSGEINAGVMTGITNLTWQPDLPVFNVSQVDCRNTPCSVFAVDAIYAHHARPVERESIRFTEILRPAAYGQSRGKIYGGVISTSRIRSAAELAWGNCEQDGRPFSVRFPAQFTTSSGISTTEL
jgi:hypothetical protein